MTKEDLTHYVVKKKRVQTLLTHIPQQIKLVPGQGVEYVN